MERERIYVGTYSSMRIEEDFRKGAKIWNLFSGTELLQQFTNHTEALKKARQLIGIEVN